MENTPRKRTCKRERSPSTAQTPRGSRQICIPMTREQYDEIWSDSEQVRRRLDCLLKECPEIFPASMGQWYQLTGRLPESKKMPGIRLRQLRTGSGVYYLRPSFVMSYMSGTVEELEHPLLLLSVDVPCWIVTEIYGRNDMFWQRHLERLGCNSIVGTTVPQAEHLPKDLAADEHHCDWNGEKGYVACTAGGGCFLGIALSAAADEEALSDAYGQFAQEAQQLDHSYEPETVNTDGWLATQNAFKLLFASVVPILCFLHGFLKIRERCRKAYELHQQIWTLYKATTKAEFDQALAEFQSWFALQSYPQPVCEAVAKFCNRAHLYALSYDHPGCHRTSNLVDRLMNRLTRLLYAGRGIHGHLQTSELRLRGWALLQNFRPFAPRSGQERAFQSPAHRLNQKQYHSHWLHNLQVCASCQGFRPAT